MVARMEFKDKLMPNNALCGMYSPRMRNLFKETAAMEPINIQPMLEFSRHRLQVYMETVPQMRMMLFQAKMNSQQQMMLNTQSTFYHQMGLNNQLMYGSAYTYSAPGVGGGFANMDLLKAEQYKQQAMGLMSNMPSATMQVGMLEQKWRAVE